MPLEREIPEEAVGLFTVVYRKVFWYSGFLLHGYEAIAKDILRIYTEQAELDADEVLQETMNILIKQAHRCSQPDVKNLPMFDPEKQEVLRSLLNSASIIAYVTDARFFLLVVDDETAKFQPLAAETIQQAQRLIMARTDIQEIERG